MTFVAELYPPYWRAMRRVKLEQANYRCQECGVEHLSMRQNLKTGEDYLVYLSVAHKNQYQTWLKDAETMVLCQRCHRRYDRQFRRKGKARTFTPIGYARLYIEQDGRPTLVEMPTTYAQLRDVVDSLPDGTQFEVYLDINDAIVGNGSYVRRGDKIEVLREYGACLGLPL